MTTKQNYPEIREAVAKLCARFPGEYWRDLDRRMAYPSEFVGALTEAGWLSVFIPEEYGGAASLSSGRGAGGNPARRLRRRRLSRPDVHNGDGLAARLRGPEASP